MEEFGPGIEAEADIVGYRPKLVDDLDERAREAAHGILLIGDHDVVSGVRDRAGEALEVEASLSKPTYFEVVARGVSKSGAVEFLAERLGVPRGRVIAFGDGENDLPMVAEAGVGVAIGNAMAAEHDTLPEGRGLFLDTTWRRAPDLCAFTSGDDVRVGTVDRFQGQEAPVVIYAIGVSSPELAPRGLDFLFSGNRLNVASSRAQARVILIANEALFDAECKTPDEMRLVNPHVRLLEMASGEGAP